MKVSPITVLNATQSLRFRSSYNGKYSTPYIKIGRHLVKTISHNTGFDRCPHLCNTAHDAPKKVLRFDSTFYSRPFLYFKNTPRYFISLTQFNYKQFSQRCCAIHEVMNDVANAFICVYFPTDNYTDNPSQELIDTLDCLEFFIHSLDVDHAIIGGDLNTVFTRLNGQSHFVSEFCQHGNVTSYVNFIKLTFLLLGRMGPMPPILIIFVYLVVLLLLNIVLIYYYLMIILWVKSTCLITAPFRYV